MNLFNLIPAVGLDGDRITQPFERRHWIAALAALVLICAASAAVSGQAEAITILILLAAAAKTWSLTDEKPKGLLDRLEQSGRYAEEGSDTTPGRRNAALALFIGLAATLALLSARLELVAPH
jgi:Zn-dependent protease